MSDVPSGQEIKTLSKVSEILVLYGVPLKDTTEVAIRVAECIDEDLAGRWMWVANEAGR